MCTDKANAKKPRPSLSKSSTGTAHRNQKEKLPKYYYCQICDAKYRDSRSLKYHIESVHEGKEPYKCNICNKGFSGEKNLKNHILTVHEDKKPFNCVICHLRFPSKGTSMYYYTACNCTMCNLLSLGKSHLFGK